MERSAKRAGEHPLPQDARLSFSFFKLRLLLAAARLIDETDFPNREEMSVASKIETVPNSCVKMYWVSHVNLK